MDSEHVFESGLFAKKQLSDDEQSTLDKLIEAGDKAFDADEFTRALDCYHRASLIVSNDSDIWSAIGLTYSNLDLIEEAWRSFKLALVSDPDNSDTLWYAAEFLFNQEDFLLSKMLLERYITIETDYTRLEEARDLLKEALLQIGDDDDIRDKPNYQDIEDLDDSSDELSGFEFADEEMDEDDELDDYGALDDAFEEDEEDDFTASLQLELERATTKCQNCSTPLPKDAPFCYICKAPHLYEV